MDEVELIPVVLVVSIFLASGCFGGGGDGQTKTYTVQSGDSFTEVKANNNTETYELTLESNMNLSEAKQNRFYQGSSEREIVSSSLDLLCGTLHQLTYNFSNVEATEEMPIIQQTPNYIWKDFEAEEVEVTVYRKGTSEKLGSCDIGPNSLGKEVLIG